MGISIAKVKLILIFEMFCQGDAFHSAKMTLSSLLSNQDSSMPVVFDFTAGAWMLMIFLVLSSIVYHTSCIMPYA